MSKVNLLLENNKKIILFYGISDTTGTIIKILSKYIDESFVMWFLINYDTTNNLILDKDIMSWIEKLFMEFNLEDKFGFLPKPEQLQQPQNKVIGFEVNGTELFFNKDSKL